MNINQMFFRAMDLDRGKVDEEARSVEVALSSEEPVRRFFGLEILRHTEDSVDLSRLNSALLNHDPNRIIGKIVNARLEGKITRATIVFDDDDEGNRAFAKVKSGSLQGASIGYAINKIRELREGEKWEGFEGPAFIATKFSIYEGSLTPIPADHTVGIGREATRSMDGIEITTGKNPGLEAKEMDKDEIQKMIRDILKEALPEAIRAIVPQPAAPPTFAVSLEEMRDLNGQAGAISQEAKARVAEMVAEGKNVNDIQRELLALATRKPDATDTPPPDSNRRDGGNGVTADKIDDDVFLRALCSPEMIPFN